MSAKTNFLASSALKLNELHLQLERVNKEISTTSESYTQQREEIKDEVNARMRAIQEQLSDICQTLSNEEGEKLRELDQKAHYLQFEITTLKDAIHKFTV